MKRSKEIRALSATAAGVTFPRTNRDFDRFTRELRELVYENFGFRAKEALDYDEESGTFYWEERERVGSLGETHLFAERTFSIDPQQPLVTEFARLAVEREAFSAEQIKMRRAILAAGGEGL